MRLSPILRPILSSPVHGMFGRETFPSGAILHFDADLDPYSEQTGGVHTFNHSVLSPQYQLNADGSYSNVGAKPAVDVFGGQKWLRSCGAVTNLLPVGAEASATWFKSGVSLTGYIVTATTSLASHYIQFSSYSYVSSKTYTFLYRIKPQYGQRFCQILGSNAAFSSAQYAVFDLEAGVVTYSTGGTAFIWQDESDPTRYWCSWAVLCTTSGESKSAAVVFTPNGAAPRLPVYAGDGIASLEIDRWMVTESSVPVPYVPPGITQPASNATTTGGSWFTLPDGSALWKALTGQPLTIATRVRMGVGSGDIFGGGAVESVLTHNHTGGILIRHVQGYVLPTNVLAGGENSVAVYSHDGTSPARSVVVTTWPRNAIINRVTQVNTDGTQYRVGYMIEGTHTTIRWSAWVNYDGSFNPSTLYRLMLGYANAYPMWFNKITAWKEQVSDARIMEAMS